MQAASAARSGWVITALAIVSGYTAINAVVKAELFPAEIRALGVGLPYALTVSLFGGTAEYVALWFKQHGHESVLLLVRDRLRRAARCRVRVDAGHKRTLAHRPRSDLTSMRSTARAQTPGL